MSKQETCPKCHGPMTDVSKDGTYAYAHAPNGVICLARQLTAEREAHALTKAELERLRMEAVKRERAYLEAALLAPEEQAESEWQVCGSTWTVYAEEIVKDQAKDIARLQAIVDRLNDNDLADRVMVRCNDPAHDERWCGTCEARGEGIDAYRLAVLNAAAAAAKEKP